MNERERRVARRYALDGWTVLRNGAPDFFMVRQGRVIAVEVKSTKTDLRPEQELVRDALLMAGVGYAVEVPDDDTRFSPESLGESSSRALGRPTAEEVLESIRCPMTVQERNALRELSATMKERPLLSRINYSDTTESSR
ncbi:MAG TPA: hypothetical protein VMG14_05620 [Thermoplasmata archaeon]|nr:hypothetical protein [Thermoplasmata archaeon]